VDGGVDCRAALGDSTGETEDEMNSVRAAQAAKEEAMERVELHADEDWKMAAEVAVRLVARRGRPFTTDEVVELLTQSNVTTHDLRALGPIMRNALREGLVEESGLWRKSSLVSCHRRPKAVWLPRR